MDARNDQVRGLRSRHSGLDPESIFNPQHPLQQPEHPFAYSFARNLPIHHDQAGI